jgi:prephenate dehydratase
MAVDAAYQGAPGAFSEAAAAILLGSRARLLGLPTLEDVFHALGAGSARAAVVPLRNSVAGDVPGVRHLIRGAGVRIAATCVMPIEMCLVTPDGVEVDDVSRIVSHPIALAQCVRYLAARPSLVVESAFDTAGALVQILRDRRRDSAAIASERAAAIWGGTVLARGIQDRADNCTEFALVSNARVSGSSPRP